MIDLFDLSNLLRAPPFLTEPYIAPPSESAELVAILCAVIALYACIRIIQEPVVMKKLPFLNLFGFAVAGTVALMLPHPLGLIAAAVFFIGSTFESNAIASTYAGGVEK